MASFFLYGFNAAAGNVLPLIAGALAERGHICTMPPPLQAEVALTSYLREVGNADLGVFCLSSTRHEFEVMRRMKKVVIIADVPGSELKPHIRDWVREQTAVSAQKRTLSGVLLAHWDARDAIAFGYPHDVLFHIGPPPHWGTLYEEMTTAGPTALRNTLAKERAPIGIDDVLVYVPGTQFPQGTNQVLGYTISAGRILFGGRFVLGFVPHPSEAAEKSTPDLQALNRVLRQRNTMLSGVPFVYMHHLTNAQRYGTADYVIDSGARTESIIAAHARRTNIVHYRDKQTVEFLKRSGLPGGRWFVAERRAMRVVNANPIFGWLQFYSALRSLMNPKVQMQIRSAQERHFPVPSTWNTAPVIAELLQNIAAEV